MKKYRKIKRLGHRSTDGILDGGRITILEKLDGNNFRVTYDDEHEKLLFGSRNVEFKEDGVPHDPDSDEIGGQFEDVAEYVADNIEDEELLSRYVVFGENMVKHSLEYNWDDVPQWLIFGAFNQEKSEWCVWPEVEQIANALGFETVPFVNEYKPEAFKEKFDPDNVDDIIPESEYRDGLAEGIVIRGDDGRRAKVVSEEFKEKHKQSSGGKHKQEHAGDDTQELANTYATEGRIRKHINKLTVDEGKDLEMDLMDELPMRVVEDIFEEEYEELVRTNKTIDFKDFRSKVAKKCVSMLRTKMQESAT